MKKSTLKILTFIFAIATLVFFSLTTAKADLMEGLVVYMDFDQGKTDVIKDLSGTGNDGTVHGDPEWVEGPKKEFGRAIELDGKGDYIEIADNDSLDVGKDDISMMLWIKHPGAAEQVDWPRIISKMPLYNTNGPGFDVLTASPKASFEVAIFYGMSKNREEVQAKQLVTDGEWHHLVALKEKNEGRIYIDGELSISGPLTPMDINNDYPLVIGGNAEPKPHTWFKGVVDEVCVYTRALEEDEIIVAMERKPYASVEPSFKLSITWGNIKKTH